jgi:hypothetical protein
MSDTTQLTQAVTDLIAGYSQTRDEMVEVLTTPADGGDAGDGKVEVTLPNGSKTKIDSVAAAYAYVDRINVQMATRLIELQTMIVQRWNEEDARD